MVKGDSGLETEVSDPRLRNRITDPQLRDKAANGRTTPSKTHKHSSGTKPTRYEHSTPYNYNALTPGTTDLLHKMQFDTGEQTELELGGQQNVEKSSTSDAHFSVPAATNGASSDQQKSTGPQQTTDYRPAADSSISHVDDFLPPYAQQPDLLPEIPDLSLDISVTSSGTNTRSLNTQSGHASEIDAHVAGRTSWPVSNVYCFVYQASFIEEPVCASCKNKNATTRGDDEPGHQIPETPEEVWRRKLQHVPRQPDELAGPSRKTLQDAQAARPGNSTSHAEHLQQGTDSSVREKPAWASAPPALRNKARKMALKRAISPLLNAHRQASGENAPSPLEEAPREVSGAEAAGHAAQAVGGGPSSEVSPLVRQSCSPVNENINNDDAGMRPDDAPPTTGLTGAKNTRCDAGPGVQSVDGSKDIRDAPAPPAKLPGSFSWPDLIGFALAEASDHCMTAAQVHQWIVDNVDGYDIHNTTHRSSIAATLSQQKAKFPKADPVTEGSRQLSRWMLASSFVSGYEEELRCHRDRLRKERSLQATRGGTMPRRKDLNAAAKTTHNPANPSTSRAAHPQKEMSKVPVHPTETEMFIKRHRVAYDADGRDIVPGFKDVPIEKWTELASVQSFKKHGIRFCVGDYINAPLPNRFKFADYTHKPLVQTMAQIEEIRQRRDGPGYAVLVQWFVTKEAADWWKCRHVKSYWPKDDESGDYVPATVWDVLTSEFVSQQEKLDPEETRRRIIQDLYFEMDTFAWLLYLKEGRGPEMGIAFSSCSEQPIQEAEDTAAGSDHPGERILRTSRQVQDDNTTLSHITHGTKSPTSLSSQQHLVTSSGIPHRLRTPRKPALTIGEGWETVDFMETLSASPAPIPASNQTLERELFTPPSMTSPVNEVSGARRTSRPSQDKRSAPPGEAKSEKRQHTGVTPDEQAAIRALLQQEQANAPYSVKDLFAAAPEYDPANALWDRDAKIAEIKARPSRKARFTQRLAFARLERSPHALHNEVDRPLPKAYKAPPFNRPGSGYGNSNSREFRFGEVDSRDADMRDATETAAHSQTTNGMIESSDPSKPEIFDTLEELLDLPTNLIPTLYDGRLAYRDGTMLLDGTLPRAKKVWKVGRKVPGELK
ncbi:hypothetical protein SLS56_005329 [Neofusicoccum ribis]|uniref:Uncharacterized protein n=1 Tax=Neofusicoccum ribis TaxID=45134 RepID=A0ABR3STS2_9PEZI